MYLGPVIAVVIMNASVFDVPKTFPAPSAMVISIKPSFVDAAA